MKPFQKAGEYIDRVMIEEKGVPGCDLIVMKDHEVLYRHTGGQVSADAHYFLFSCSKPVTVAAAMQLVEAGKLDLNGLVSAYLPAFSELLSKRMASDPLPQCR